MAKNKNETVTETTELVTTSTANAALAVDSDDDDGFGEFQGHQATVTADELITERFRIVQAMSKVKNETTPKLQDGQLYGSLSRVGINSAVIVVLHEYRTIVERTGDSKGSFIREYQETKFGSNDFGDPGMNSIVKKAGFKDTYKVELPSGNKLSPTYNCYVAFLDEATGTECKGFGVLQADKTNIRPFLKFMQDRVAFDGAERTPLFAIRTRVDGYGVYKNPEGNVTQLYRFNPFVEKDWKASRLSGKPKAQGGNYELLKKLEEHKKLVVSGAIKVAEVETEAEGLSEEAAEEAAF